MQKNWTFIKELPNEEPKPIMTANKDEHTQGNTWEYTVIYPPPHILIGLDQT